MSKTLIDTAEALKEKDVFFKMGVPVETGERLTDHPEAFLTYKFTFRCRDCGKEWTKLRLEEVGLPNEFVEDEEEESDYEVEKEGEDTREEYATQE